MRHPHRFKKSCPKCKGPAYILHTIVSKIGVFKGWQCSICGYKWTPKMIKGMKLL